MSYAGKPYLPPGPIAPPQDATNPLGTVALVLGILSVFMGCPLAIGALITGWVGMKREPSGMARAGFYIGLIMTIFNVIAGLVGLMFFVLFIGLAGVGAYIDSQEGATVDYSSYPVAEYPSGAPDMAPYPVGMPPMEIPKMPDPYVPPPMTPGMDPTAYSGDPDFGTPPRFSPPSGLGPSGLGPSGMGPSGMGRGPAFPPGAFGPGAFPPGAYPPGLGPPTTMETLTPTSEGSDPGFGP